MAGELADLIASETARTGPLALARAHRAQTARTLLASTELSIADVAFASGFSSIRQFNETLQTACGSTPTLLRRGALRRGNHSGNLPAGQTVSLRLAVREPFAYEGVFGHLAASALPGCGTPVVTGLGPVLGVHLGSGALGVVVALELQP